MKDIWFTLEGLYAVLILVFGIASQCLGQSSMPDGSLFDQMLPAIEEEGVAYSGCRVCAAERNEPRSGLVRRMLEAPPDERDSENVTIDVMFAYSHATKLGSAQEDAVRQEIEDSLRLANRIFADSKTGVQFRLVALTPVNYQDAGDIAVDLNRLRTRHSSTEAIWQRREACLADVVCLLVERDNYWGGAIANRPTAPDHLTPNYGHVVIYRADLSPSILAHEFGHLFGCTHDRAAAGNTVLYPYAYGNHLEVEGIPHRTIMAYHPGVEVPLFSSSNLSYRNVLTGARSLEFLRTDNAQVIRNTAPMLAAYYNHELSVEFENGAIDVLEDESMATFRILRAGNLERETTVVVRARNQVAEDGVDFELPEKRLVFAPGEDIKEFEIHLINDELVEGTETVEFSLRALQRGEKVVRVGPIETMQLSIVDDDSLVSFVTKTARAREGDESVVISVKLDGSGLRLLEAESSVTVPFRVLPISAEANLDYRASSGELVFTTESLEQSVIVELLEDSEPERVETLEVRIGDQAALVSVLDNDGVGSRVGAKQWQSAVNGAVWTIVPLFDGRAVIGGSFTEVNGKARHGLARVHVDGSLDDSFEAGALMAGFEQDPATYPPTVFKIIPLRSGKLLAMGHFTSVGEARRGFVVRLNGDGPLDPSFNPSHGADSWVTDAVEQEDGKVVLVGLFHHFNGTRARGIARVNPDGSLDSTFKINPGPSGWAAFLYGICQQPDGELIVTGFFGKYHNRPLSNIARLNPDGTVDTDFHTIGENIGLVMDAALDPDGGIYIHGFFERFNRRNRSRITRLLDDGNVDLSFNLRPALNGKVQSMAVAPNGDLILGGAFSRVADGEASHLLRVHRDGTIDPSFQLDRGPDDHVYSVAFSSDHSLLVGGRFQNYDGLSAGNLAQVNIDGLEPVMTSVHRDADELVLDIRGRPGQTVFLETSSTLDEWDVYREFRLESERQQARMPMLETMSQQFFRLGKGGSGD